MVVSVHLGKLALRCVAFVVLVCLACGDPNSGGATDEQLMRGVELQEDGHIEQAFQAFSSAIEDDPRNAEAYARTGVRLHSPRRFYECGGGPSYR